MPFKCDLNLAMSIIIVQKVSCSHGHHCQFHSTQNSLVGVEELSDFSGSSSCFIWLV